MELPKDLRDLLHSVYAAVPRLLAIMDRDADSPMRGCLHPAYWRDKSSDVADVRRQEAALTLAWLFRHDLPGNPWHGSRELLLASRRALGFWCRSQHTDGTFDEWYRGEHGYAVTAFSSFAIALTVEALGADLPDPQRETVLAALRRSAKWLRTHHDFFKTNHEAVGVGALAALGRVLDDPSCHEAARRNLDLIVARTTSEGWSREITGADLGYTFLLVEALALHARITGESRHLGHIASVFDLAADHLHPDLTSGAEYGICSNPYFSRVATVALAPHSRAARDILAWMAREDLRAAPPETLQDELRLARYAFQPILAALMFTGRFPLADLPNELGSQTPWRLTTHDSERFRPEAGLLVVARPGYVAWAAPCHGGLVRVAFRDGTGFLPTRTHRGYAFTWQGSRYRNARYSRQTPATWGDGVLEVTAPIEAVRFVMPPYWARVGLRLATALPGGPKWARRAIDWWRARKGTALNQSSAGVGGPKSPFQLHRRVRFFDDHLVLEDTLSGLPPSGLEGPYASVDGGLRFAEGGEADEDRRLEMPADLPGTSFAMRWDRSGLHAIFVRVP